MWKDMRHSLFGAAGRGLAFDYAGNCYDITRPDFLNQGHGKIKCDYEYKRFRTISLLAAIDLLTGEAIPLARDPHNSNDFIDFLKILNSCYFEGDTIQVMFDNHSVHTYEKIKELLETIPGWFVFIFTPKHGSWLNMIEGFFEKMTC